MRHALRLAVTGPALVLLVAGLGCGDPGAGAGTGHLAGRVIDAFTETPVGGASVRLEGTELVATTDALGQWELEAPVGGHRLHVEAPGYFGLSRAGLVVRQVETTETEIALYAEAPEPAVVQAEMDERARRQALRDDPSDPALRPEAAALLRGDVDAPRFDIDAEGEVAGARAALTAPPETVRIWRRSIDGASTSCSGRIDIIPLEEYVKGVLPHEWIPSWHDESLKAGSLAIRTYVWNWVLRGGKYDCADLDDTTRSQVYQDDRMDVTNRAVDATRGEAIAVGADLASGEYSAENGSPTAYGVNDPHCAGRALYGHGRGMCQWGSQRWALDGKDHRWIATHYYPGSAIAGGGPPLPAYAAELVGVDHPAEMTSGERAVAWVELRNTGATTWDLSNTWIGTTLPADHASPFYDEENWASDHRATTPDHSSYGTGVVGRFSFMISAPEVTEETVVTDTFGVVQEGVSWFGPEDITITITVRPRDGTMPAAAPSDEDPTDPTEPIGEGGDAGLGAEEPGLESRPGGGAADGTLSGGCSASGSGDALPAPWVLLAGLVLLARGRRRR